MPLDLSSLRQAISSLEDSVEVATRRDFIDSVDDKARKVIRAGVIQNFEFTFELCWKTLKDYLESQGVTASFPREVIKQAFHYELLNNGEIWLEMLSKRNLLAHTYDRKMAEEAYNLITKHYLIHIQQLVSLLGKITDE
jgi:nucleotidyltransferase substrate binding protein (TIGR01987 family)